MGKSRRKQNKWQHNRQQCCIRAIEKSDAGQMAGSICSAVVIGILMGLAAKLVDNPELPQIFDAVGGRLGIWIFTASLLAVYSASPKAAAVRVFSFFAATLLVYYVYTVLLLGFFPKRQIIFWSFCALISPVCAYVMWFAHGKGWFAGICASLPVSVLAAEIYRSPEDGFLLWGIYCFMAVVLLIFLPEGKKQRVFAAVDAFALTVVLVKFNILALLFGGWNTFL